MCHWIIHRFFGNLLENAFDTIMQRVLDRIKKVIGENIDELAHAYNNLAAQLQANEQRKLEMLGQVALALNHELNNAAEIIELQLQLAGRQSSGNPSLEKCARQIRDSLNRMTRTVDLLKQVRRIVLTDYVSGVKMLDLERSASPEEGNDEAHVVRNAEG